MLARAAPGHVATADRTIGLLGNEAVLVPVKSFDRAKLRLGGALSPDERRSLARRMAEHVLSAARPLPVAVVCDDRQVADWARRLGALVVWEPGRGLDGAVEAGVERFASFGVRQVIVAHSDLPLASGLAAVPAFDGVTLVPDRRGDGTNVIRLPVGCGFRFSYGPGSFQRHRAQCATLGLPTLVLDHPSLSLDVDSPSDLVASGWSVQSVTSSAAPD
jgi:2-phospho-L-lactate/phosphoenolpyruvate guanylyltransferase